MEDVFFPYALQETWKEYAESICAHRRRINPSFHVEPPQRHDVAIKHFPESFLPAWASRGFDEADDDPMDLPTPNVDRIFTDQLLQPETMRWIYALLGRLLYETGTHDQWQVLLFFKGIAGSGKSTLAKIMRHVYPPSLVASLSSNVEPRFGLAPLYDKFLVICAEVKRDFGMNQGDLQVFISGTIYKCIHESYVLCNVDRSKKLFFTCDPYVPRNNRTCKVRLEVHPPFFKRLNCFVFKWLAIRYTWPILNVSPKFHNTLIIADGEEQPVLWR